MSRNNSGFTIGGKRQPSSNAIRPSMGVSGASPALAATSTRSAIPGVRGSTPAHTGRTANTPGLRNNAPSAKNDRLGPPKGQVLTSGRVNGIEVRVSAPLAPDPVAGSGKIIDTKARERDLDPNAPAGVMAAASTTLVAGIVKPGSRPKTPTPVVEVAAVETPAVEAAPEDSQPAGTYWSDKHDKHVSPGDPDYSNETAQKMGVAV